MSSRYNTIHTKLTARHPLVRFINSEWEAERTADLGVETVGGECVIYNRRTEKFTIIDGTPSFKSRAEALSFIERAREIARGVRNRKWARERQ